jgi:Fur family peroxide stress response transcriptional regulator
LNLSLEQIKGRFREIGIKATLPRIVIYRALLKFSYHPSAEEIYDIIRKKHPGVSLATIYKTLDVLVKSNLANKVVTDEDKVRYDARMDEHIHLYCQESKKIIDYDDPILNKIIEDYLKTNQIPGFSISQIQININGILTPNN